MKKFKSVSTIFLSGLLLVASITSTYGADVQQASQVFDAQQIELEIAKARQQPLYTDKNTKGTKMKKTAKTAASSGATTFATVASGSYGTYPTRKGVILVTEDKYKGLLPTGHAGIIYTSTSIVESLSNGVTTGPNDWKTSKNTCYGVTVKSTTAAQDSAAANWCYKQIGKPYNYNYLNSSTRKSFYCSQLVYAAFLDNFGINLDTNSFLQAVHPIELVNTSQTSLIYQK